MAASEVALSLPSILANPLFPPLPRPQPNLPLSISDPPPASIPPPPDPPPNHLSPILSTSSQPLPLVRWTSLFASKPRSAGDFSPPKINLKYSGKSLIPTADIVQASIDVWNDYISGFFLDSPLSFTAVVTHLERHWSPRGPIKIKSNGRMFFFLFANPEDRKRILEADTLVIRNKVFILQKWNVNMGNSGKEVQNVPIWIKMSNLPMVAWSKIGICWLATHIGKFLCMDRATESLDWLSYAKVMVEITPESELPNNISVLLDDGTEHLIVVDYYWKPDVCHTCKKFGHTVASCPCNDNVTMVKSNSSGGNAHGEKSNGRNVKVASKKGSDQVGTQVHDGIVGHNLSKQFKVTHTSNLAKQRVPSFDSLEWKKVDCKKASKGKSVALNDSAVVQIGNSFATLENRINACDAQPSMHEREEGEICEVSKGSEMGIINDDVSAKDDQMQTMSSQDIEFIKAVNAGEFDVNLPLNIPAVQSNTECNFRPGFLNPVRPITMNAGRNPMQNLLDEVRIFGNKSIYGGSAVPSASTTPGLSELVIGKENEQDGMICSNVMKLAPDAQHIVENLDGFLKNGDKQKEFQEQREMQWEGYNNSTDLMHVPHQMGQNLDEFLLNNFNLSNSSDVPKSKSPLVTVKAKSISPAVTVKAKSSDVPKSISQPAVVKAKKVRKNKTMLELIESTKTEIASGELSEDVCEGKRQVIASMMRNYKDDLHKPCGPYANIPPPPGFKAPPPDVGDETAAAASASSSLCINGKSPVTRSMMRAMKHAVFDNG